MITDYATLKSELALLLRRSDLTAAILGMIQRAEARFKKDERVRKHTDRGAFSISADGATLPSDLVQLESWYHDGPTYFGPIEIVRPDEIGRLKLTHGATGVPSFAALVDTAARFAPEPNATYTTYMTYWRTITALSDSNTTNWLLTERPDIYLYGAAVESAPWLRHDERLVTWEGILGQRLDDLDRATQNKRLGGPMRRQFNAIG